MEDKDIYSYFKEHSSTFNEVPGDDLWNKIEGVLNAAPSRPWFRNNLMIAIAITAIAVGIVFYKRTPLIEHEVPAKTVITTSPPPFIQQSLQETVDVKAMPDVQPVNDTVKKKKLNGIIKQNYPQSRQEEIIERDSMKFSFGIIKTSTIKSFGRIVVRSQDKLTKIQFDSLVARSLELHKDATTQKLIVWAKGHKRFERVSSTKKEILPFAPVHKMIKSKTPAGFLPQDSILSQIPAQQFTPIIIKNPKINDTLIKIQKPIQPQGFIQFMPIDSLKP